MTAVAVVLLVLFAMIGAWTVLDAIGDAHRRGLDRLAAARQNTRGRP
jgi:uncharacterized membrane protein YqjE